MEDSIKAYIAEEEMTGQNQYHSFTSVFEFIILDSMNIFL